MGTRVVTLAVVGCLLGSGHVGAQEAAAPAPAERVGPFDYLLLATKKTSTLEKEMGEAAEAGYRLAYMMGGETAFGGDEVVAVMQRDESAEPAARYAYVLLATNKTSTMKEEMSEAAEAGYVFRAQSVAETTFGGREVLVIMERDLSLEPVRRAEYRLLATQKTSTMQKELREAGREGYEVVGMTVAQTMFAGMETVAILERPAP